MEQETSWQEVNENKTIESKESGGWVNRHTGSKGGNIELEVSCLRWWRRKGVFQGCRLKRKVTRVISLLLWASRLSPQHLAHESLLAKSNNWDLVKNNIYTPFNYLLLLLLFILQFWIGSQAYFLPQCAE